MTTEDAQRLLRRYLAGDCTAEEKELLEAWWTEIQEEFPWEVPTRQTNEIHDRMLSKIRISLAGEGESGEIAPVRQLWRRYAVVAAAVLIIAGGGWFFWSLQHDSGHLPGRTMAATDAQPGGNHAILTLSNGRHIVLDSAANGTLAMQGNDRVVKQDGSLNYQRENQEAEKAVLFNTLSTPRGGQYHLILPDGTKVWLDAASSITYPTAFTGKTRQVSISGQAYFEVVHNPAIPFEVSVRGQTVRDIGTSFNINAYTDEPALVVTLASGSASVGGPENIVMLSQAGQQVECRDGKVTPAHDADLESVLAWKNGRFYLTSADVADVMRQLSRWYDIDIQYENGIPSGHITGEVPRDTKLSTVLKVLQTSGVHCSVEGKKLLVTP
jgi:transmembrane sensor